MPWASNDGGEDGPGGVISSESGLAHAGSIVHNQSSNVLVTHLVGLFHPLFRARLEAETRWVGDVDSGSELFWMEGSSLYY